MWKFLRYPFAFVGVLIVFGAVAFGIIASSATMSDRFDKVTLREATQDLATRFDAAQAEYYATGVKVEPTYVADTQASNSILLLSDATDQQALASVDLKPVSTSTKTVYFFVQVLPNGSVNVRADLHDAHDSYKMSLYWNTANPDSFTFSTQGVRFS